MRKLNTSITFLAILVLLFISCSKKEAPQVETPKPFSNLYKNGGVAHNESLNAFIKELDKRDSKLSSKIKSITKKYAALHTSRSTLARETGLSSQGFAELRDDINRVVAEEVVPISISYLEANGYYNDFYSVGINNPQVLINQVVQGIYNNAAFSNDEYVNQVITQNSSNFRNFVPALKSLIENNWSSSDFFSSIDALKDSYLSQTTNDIEALAIINGCETAKASHTYWNDPVNTTNWDATILYSFNSGRSTNNFRFGARIANDSRSRGEIIAADACGAIVGVVEGARIGALAGPGGAMVVGMTGMVLRGAQASLGDYVKSKVLDWLGW